MFQSLLPILLLAAVQGPRPEASSGPKGPAPQGLVQRLELPRGSPLAFEVDVVHRGRLAELRLRRYSLRAAEATLFAYGPDGATRAVDLPAPTTYRGHVAGRPGSVVLASLFDGVFSAEVLDGGDGWSVEPVDGRPGVVRTRTQDHDHWKQAFELCGFEAEGHRALPLPVDPGREELVAGQPPPAGRCLTLAEIAFDADFEYYQVKGASIAAVMAAIEAILNQVEYFYARDVLITYELTSVVVRTTPFYAPVDGGDLLNLFRTEWNTNQTAVPRDIAHLMTGKPGSLIQYGGLAWVGVVCSSSGYGWSMDGANIVGHEVGHNWGAGHCHDPTPCNNMCGACFYVGPETKRIIEAHRDSRACLESAPHYAVQLPPYAHPEGMTIVKSELDELGPTAFDVLANDHDGNCEDLLLTSFDRVSAMGGTVRRSPRTAPFRRDELVYSPPADVFVGTDTFRYEVSDLRGGRTTGTVSIDVRPLELQSYWSFDEGAGQVAADLTPNRIDATAQAPAVWVPGQHGGALAFDGVSQLLSSNGTGFGAPWTVSAWFRRQAGTAPSAALIESADGSLRTEQYFNTKRVGVTRYGVGDVRFNYTLPLDTWVHLAFVGTESTTTLYVDGQLDSVRNTAIEAPFAPASRAGDPLSGELDELRVYRYALDPTEIAELHDKGGRAVVPHPRDGGSLADPSGSLSFVPGLLADSHDVYFGTSYTDVRDADTGSPTFQGNQLGNSFTPGGILQDQTYFWRVDEHVGGDVLRGAVWQFELIDFHRWTLDETSGNTAFDSEGGVDGTYWGTPQQNQAPAAPSLSASVRFDGINDRVALPALDLHSNQVTITAWLRRSGSQSSFAGIVFNRAASTTAGLNFGTADELRYHWNGDSNTWSWDSGLVVPDDTWVFVALVIEPGRGTLYLGDGGVLSSAVNGVSHAPEEFDGVTNIARDPTGGRWFDGWLDDVRIYRGALSPADVDALYQSF